VKPAIAPAGDSADVLMVEDDESIAEMYAWALTDSGYRVRFASSGALALELAKAETQPSVVILDLQLGDIGGLDVLTELRHREATTDLPVIVLSNQDGDFPEAYRLGATECHTKVRTSPLELVSYVQEVTGGGPHG
jgi:DNA-binding response OmpR family regulator